MSYSTDGLMTVDEIEEILKDIVSLILLNYTKFLIENIRVNINKKVMN